MTQRTRSLALALFAAAAMAAAPVLADETKPAAAAPKAAAAAATVTVNMETNLGTIVLELWPAKAPKTVENFLQYAKDGHYDNTVFHRIVPGFVIQGGGYDLARNEKPTRPPIVLEAGETNAKYTIAMARTQDPNSASSQFFINLVDNSRSLDKGGASGPHGYAVFGKVVKGQGIVEQIGRTETRNLGGAFNTYPVTEVKVTKVTVAP